MGKKLLSILLLLCLLTAMLTVSALAANGLPEADSNGVITLTENVTLTSSATLTDGQTLNAGGYTITGGSYKITLAAGAKVTSDVDNDLYDVLAGEGRYYIAYTDSGNLRTYVCSDIVTDSSGYGVFMAGHPAVIEQYGSDPEDLQITYTDEGSEYVLRYLNANDCAAVIYGGVKDIAVDDLNTSLTLKSGTVAALVAGSKIPAYDSSGSKIAETGSVATAVITIEGGSVLGDEKCSGQPYASQGMVMGVWYTGPNIQSFTFNMTGGKIIGQVFGGSATSSYSNANYEAITVENFTANISGGMITGDLFAGAQDVNTAANSTQTVKNAQINISGDASVTQVFGGGFANWNGALTVVEKSEINMNGGSVGIIYGGGQNGLSNQYNNSAASRVDNVTINVNGGEVIDVYGGGYNFHWVNSYWVADDGSVIKVDYNDKPIAGDMTHYSDVTSSTINVNGGTIMGEVSLGGRSWAHVGTSTANINADVDSVSGLGNYGYVENSNINVKEGATVGMLDLVRSGIVGNSTVTNNGTIDTLIAGAPANRYVDNMGVNKVGVLGDVSITSSGSVGKAQLTYGLELADSVASDVPLVMTAVDYGAAKDGTSSSFQPQENSDWSGATVVMSAGTTFTPASGTESKAPAVQFSDGTVVQPGTDGSYTGKAAKVGDTYHDSLEEAIGAAGDNAVITLLSDVTLTHNITIDKNLTIEGVNKDLPWDSAQRKTETAIITYVDQSGSNEGGRIIIADGKSVTFDGVAITGTYAADMAAPMIGMKGTAQLTIKNSIVADTGSNHSSGYGLINTMSSTEGGKLTITESRITGVLGDESGTNPPTYYAIGGGGTCEFDIQNNLFETGRWVIFGTTASGTFSGNEVVKSNTAPASASSSVINSTNLNGLVISDNVFDESLAGTRFVIAGGYDIKDNVFENLGEDLALYITGGPGEDQTASITGNTFNMTEDSYGIRFINVSWGTGGDVSKVTVEDNTFTDKGVYQIRVEDSGDGGNPWTGLLDALDNNYPAGVNMEGNVAALDLAGGDFAADKVEITVEDGTYYVTLPTPERGGYTFLGWSDGTDSYKGGDKVALSVAQSLTAQWSKKSSGGTVTPTPTPTPEPEELPFTDVAEGQWFYEAVQYVYDAELMNGITETTFEPDSTTTRGMIVTVLWRMEGEPEVSGESAFTDVAAGSWYEDAINWAAANDIVNGYGEGIFAPDREISREEMAAILCRYAAFAGIDVSGSGDLTVFPDADSVSDWAETNVAWAVAEGLLTGRDDTTLDPAGTATRAEIATILMRYCENVAK